MLIKRYICLKYWNARGNASSKIKAILGLDRGNISIQISDPEDIRLLLCCQSPLGNIEHVSKSSERHNKINFFRSQVAFDRTDKSGQFKG